MMSLRRVLLLLCVAVLLREGTPRSTLELFRDLKNRIFLSRDTTNSPEKSSTQCSPLDQDGVCVLQNNTVIGPPDVSDTSNTVISETPEFTNTTQDSNNSLQQSTQFEGNNTGVEDAYNTNYTQYYDEQEWNNTASNNASLRLPENYENYEYPENGQNGNTTYDEAAIGDKTNNQTEVRRKKRQVANEMKENTPLKSVDISTGRPLTLNITVLIEKIDSTTNHPVKNEVNDSSGNKQVISEATENITIGTQSDPSTLTTIKIGNESSRTVESDMGTNKIGENKEIIGKEADETTKIPWYGSNQTVPINTIETNNEKTSQPPTAAEERSVTELGAVNCSTCTPSEENKKDLNVTEGSYLDVTGNEGINVKNSTNRMELTTATNFQSYINATNSTFFENIKSEENSTQVSDSDSTTTQSNFAKLKDVLDNSTHIIANMVQNIAPAIFGTSPTTEGGETTQSNLQIEGNSEEQYNSSSVEPRELKIVSSNETSNQEPQLNSTLALKNNTNEENTEVTNIQNEINTIKVLNGTANSNNTGLNASNITPLSLNSSISPERNFTEISGVNEGTQTNVSLDNSSRSSRERRSINFTICSDEEEETDVSTSTFPETTDSPTEYNTTLNSSEPNSLNETEVTQGIEVVGPVCYKRYEQCTNSTDCCDDFECIAAEENNSTSYCDLKSGNSSLSTPLPSVQSNEDPPL